jgi:hypothetical protein
VPEIIYEEYSQWMDKYEKLSEETCIMCGKPGKLIDNGWIMPLCKACEEEGWM